MANLMPLVHQARRTIRNRQEGNPFATEGVIADLIEALGTAYLAAPQRAGLPRDQSGAGSPRNPDLSRVTPSPAPTGPARRGSDSPAMIKGFGRAVTMPERATMMSLVRKRRARAVQNAARRLAHSDEGGH
jgi:hypothetical protein